MRRHLRRGSITGVIAILAMSLGSGVAFAETESRNGYKKCPPGQNVYMFSISDAVHGTVTHGWTAEPPGPYNPWHTRTWDYGIHHENWAGNEAWWFVTATTANGYNPIADVIISCE